MADPICRWRNATPETLCEIVNELPKTEMPENEFRDSMAKSKFGSEFFRTPYQFACQLALYYIDDDKIYYPRFRNNISIEEADKYLHHWFSLYYVPNPYTKKGFKEIERPLFFEQTLAEKLKLKNESSNFQDLLKLTFKDEIGEIDILRNLINKYSTFLKVENDIISLTEKGKSKMEINVDRDDKKSFFKSFDEKTDSSASPYTNPKQIIFYGVPGCGKSYSIEKELRKLGITKMMETDCIKRVVFHPEYTNADFVGQILPQSVNDGEKVSYPFVAGPFTQILAKAYTHKNTPYALIIEEINRGNAAAIFGELFQLLDRLDKDETGMSNEVLYQKNWSCYPVTNDNINKAIFAAYDKYKDDKNEKGEEIFVPFIEKELFEKYKLNIGIRLPPNLSILATMNTSDQNVFKLDNAFKRRWDLQLVPNEFGDENEELSKEEEAQRDAKVEGFDFTWNEFRTAINEVISSPDNSFDSSSFSDKQLGCWFVKAEDGKIKREVFVHKVLEYLWDDVLTFEKTLVFEKKYQTFAELSNSVLKDKKKDVFSENFLHILNAQKQKSEDKETNSAAEKSQSETPENQQNQDL